MSPSAVRRYALRLRQAGGGVDARVERYGPADPLAVAVGRAPEDAPRLAGLIFSICPMAQTAAALGALEAISGRPPAGAKAREALVLAEAVAGAVWRAGMTQAELLDRQPLIEPVRGAREAVEALRSALFQTDWRQIGGVEPRVDKTAAQTAAARLRNALDAAAPVCKAVQDRVQAFDLASYFLAQTHHAEALMDQLEVALALADQGAPRGLTFVSDGTGEAEIPTARGPLRHVIEVRQGQIATWRAEAPTDKNFADGGPVELAAKHLSAGPDLADRARWLVAAFDPCAPVEVIEEEAVHA